MALERGLVQVYTGEGKGKTTAALGLALRAAGHGLCVEIVQFMKGWPGYGELKGVDWLPSVTIHLFGRDGWVHPTEPDPEDRARAAEALAFARQVMVAGEVDILVLDEINVALDYGLFELESVLDLLDDRPPLVEIVLTGRSVHPEIARRADLVTEMHKVKHPFDGGIHGRQGIEF
ncbi:cob(I)yrinic acid a,c-diamide adenosyltransferase [Chloroflexota bacterium]